MRDVDPLAAGVGRPPVKDLRTRRRFGRVLVRHREGPLLELADAIEVIGNPRFRGGAEWRIGAGVEPVVVHHRIQHTALESLAEHVTGSLSPATGMVPKTRLKRSRGFSCIVAATVPSRL